MPPSQVNTRRLARYLKKKGSPFWKNTPAIVRAASSQGIDPRFLIAVSGAETQFGKLGGAANINNAWGWGPGIKFGSWGEAANTISRGLKSGYIDQGLDTIPEIHGKWAPVGAGNDPGGLNQHWTKNVSQYYRELGGNPSGPVAGASWKNVNVPGGSGTEGVSVTQPGGSITIPGQEGYDYNILKPGQRLERPLDWNKVIGLHRQQMQNVQQGQFPDQQRFAQMMRLIQRSIPVQGPPTQNSYTVPGTPDRTVSFPDQTYNFPGAPGDGPPQQGLGGEWGGSKRAADLILQRAAGADWKSRFPAGVGGKRSAGETTSSGNLSDHAGNARSAWAYDLMTQGGVPTPNADKVASRIVRMLGGPRNYFAPSRGTDVPVFNKTVGPYRYQLIYRTPDYGGHLDHIHLGVRRVTPSSG